MIQPFRTLTSPLRRHSRLSCLALILVVLAAGASALFLWPQYHVKAAQRALERYAFEEAQRHLELALKVRWGNAELHLLAAQTARRRDTYDEAERHLAECIRLGGMTSAAALERMLLTTQQGEFDREETTLRARTDPDDPDAVLVLEALAKGYANRFWNENSLVCLNILLQRRPDHPQALLMRARNWENRARKGEMEREQDALRDYEKAVDLDPSFEAQLGLAGTLYRVGRPWEALLIYERLRPAQPANPAVLLGLARCRYSLHEVDEAQRLLDELLEKSPGDAAALLERGRLALHAGQWDEAEKLLRRAASAAPRYDAEAQRALCRCLEAEDKTAEARSCREELHQREAKILELERLILRANREPQDVALRYAIALELMRQGREQDGVAALFFILEQQPRHEPAREALADYFERTGQPGRAARHRRAIFSSARTSSSSR
jgi:tetratricopeptide (TPR) repeat protein